MTRVTKAANYHVPDNHQTSCIPIFPQFEYKLNLNDTKGFNSTTDHLCEDPLSKLNIQIAQTGLKHRTRGGFSCQKLQGSLEGSREGVAFEHEVEKDNGVVARGDGVLGKGHLVGGPTDRFKVGEDLIGEILDPDNGRSHGWGQGRAGVLSIKEPEDLSLCSGSCWPGTLSFPI